MHRDTIAGRTIRYDIGEDYILALSDMKVGASVVIMYEV
jgi:hypothetical protein